MKRSANSRRFLGILLIIAAVALIVRLVVGFELKSSYPPVVSPSPQTDCHTYLTMAKMIVDGTYDYSKGFYYQPFVYAVYLPLIFLIFGKGATGIIVIQSMLGAATVVICGYTFALVFGRRCGLIAAVLLALARFHVFYTPFALIACVQSFLISVMAMLTILAARRRSWHLWALCGLAFGIANLTRGNVILLLPLAIALVAWRLRTDRKQMALAIGLLVGGFVLPQLPFSIVNYRATGSWQGPSTAGGAVLALGNTPEAPPGGREPVYEAGGMAYPPSFADWTGSHNATGKARISVGANVFRWIRREPLAWIELKARMFLLFWNKMEIPNNVSILYRGKPVPSAILHLPFMLNFWLLGGLGIAGMVVALRRFKRHPSGAFLAGMALVYSLSIVVFYVLARFRVPMIPLICGFAALTIDTLYRRYRTKSPKHRSFQLLAVLALLGIVFVSFGYDAYRYGWEPAVLRAARPNGVQVPLTDRYLIRDNGPFEFGSWSQRTGANVHFSKTIRPPLEPLDRFDRCVVKIFLATNSPTAMRWTVNGIAGESASPGGAGWIEAELPMGALVKKDDGFLFDCMVATTDGQPLAFFLDLQRQYGRTAIGGQPVEGELVFEVCFFRKTDVE